MLAIGVFAILSALLLVTVSSSPIQDYIFNERVQKTDDSSDSNDDSSWESDDSQNAPVFVSEKYFEPDSSNEIAQDDAPTVKKNWSVDQDYKNSEEYTKPPKVKQNEQPSQYFQAGPVEYQPDLPVFDRNILLRMREQQRQRQLKIQQA